MKFKSNKETEDNALLGIGTPSPHWSVIAAKTPDWPRSPRELLVSEPYAPAYKEGASEEESARFTMLQTAGAYAYRWPRSRVQRFKYVDPTIPWCDVPNRDREIFEMGSLLLQQRGFAPIAWVSFRLFVFQDYAEYPKHIYPNLSYVFNAEKITDQRGWFKRTSYFHMGGKVYLLTSGLRYMREWRKLCAEVERGGEVRKLVSAFRRKYDDVFVCALLDAHKAAEAHKQAQLRGDFIWKVGLGGG